MGFKKKPSEMGVKESTLKELGWKPDDSEPLARLIVSIEGIEKSGKSNIGYTAPDPIVLFDTDIGTEGVISKFNKTKRIYVRNFHTDIPAVDKDEMKKVFDPICDRYSEEWMQALHTKDVRTIIGDNMSEAWEYFRLAGLGQLTHVKPHHYGPVNARFRSLLRAAFNSDKNVILIHRLKPAWKMESDGDGGATGKQTGELVREGFKNVGFIVQANCRASRDMKDENKPFLLEIIDSRHNAEAAGTVLKGKRVNFKSLAMAVMPEVDPKEWD